MSKRRLSRSEPAGNLPKSPRLILVLFVSIALPLVKPHVGDARKWTDKSGAFALEAEFVELTTDKRVKLKTVDGKLMQIPLDQLSATDQEFVASAGSKTNSNPFQPVESPFQPDEPSLPEPVKLGQVVVATGVGLDAESALRNAFQEAVRQSVGTLVDAEVLIKNDNLIEDKVIAISGGFVKQYDKLSEQTKDGLVRIKIAARIEQRKLLGTLRDSDISVKQVAGEDLFAELSTKLSDQLDADALKQKLLAGYPASVIEANVVGMPRVSTVVDGQAVVEYDLKIGVNLEKFDAIQAQLVELLDRTVDNKGEFHWQSATTEKRARFLRDRMIDDFRGFVEWLDSATQDQIGGRDAKEGPDGRIQLGTVHSLTSNNFTEKRVFGEAWWKTWHRADKTMPVVINTTRNALHSRTSWKWFHVPATFGAKLGATVIARFVDQDGKEILRDAIHLASNAPGAMAPYHNNGGALVISAYWVYGHDGYTDSVTIRRTVRLTSDELRSLKTVRCHADPR